MIRSLATNSNTKLRNRRNLISSLLKPILLVFLCLQFAFGQEYLVDRTTNFALFDNNNIFFDVQQYQYDDQSRILKIVGNFQVQDYVYHNQYDHSIITHNVQSNYISPRFDYFYNDEGLIISEERHIYNSQSQEYWLESRNVFEYDEESNLIKELRYFTYIENGVEHLLNTFDFNYEDGKLINTVEVYFTQNSSNYITTTSTFQYNGDYLISEEQIIQTNAGQSSYSKSLDYNIDHSLKSIVTYNLNENDTLNRTVEDYIHTEHGTEIQYAYYSYWFDEYTYTYEYHSMIESPFYEKDTFTRITYYDEVESRSTINSHTYSVTMDSAFVRQDYNSEGPDVNSFLSVTKHLYIKKGSIATNITEEDSQVAKLYPSSASPNSTIIIQKIVADIDRAEIFNSLGQRIQVVNLQNKEQVVFIAPSQTGSYFVVFSSEGLNNGKISRLVIQN